MERLYTFEEMIADVQDHEGTDLEVQGPPELISSGFLNLYSELHPERLRDTRTAGSLEDRVGEYLCYNALPSNICIDWTKAYNVYVVKAADVIWNSKFVVHCVTDDLNEATNILKTDNTQCAIIATVTREFMCYQRNTH